MTDMELYNQLIETHKNDFKIAYKLIIKIVKDSLSEEQLEELLAYVAVIYTKGYKAAMKDK